jgi:hypothetical protein
MIWECGIPGWGIFGESLVCLDITQEGPLLTATVRYPTATIGRSRPYWLSLYLDCNYHLTDVFIGVQALDRRTLLQSVE